MKNNKLIRGVLVSVNEHANNSIKEHYFARHENDLYDIYAMLKCTCIDVQERTIGTRKYDIYLDDEGRFKSVQIPSVVTTRDNKIVEIIVGNVFICASDNEGDMKSLTEEEVQEVINSIKNVFKRDGSSFTCVHAHV